MTIAIVITEQFSVTFLLLYKSIVYSFSLAAALLLPIKRLIEVKDLPTHRDSATLLPCIFKLTTCHKSLHITKNQIIVTGIGF